MADGSFEEFYEAAYHRLLRQLVLVTRDRGDAEDLLQDAYGRAPVRWRRLRDYQAPEAWVRRGRVSARHRPGQARPPAGRRVAAAPATPLAVGRTVGRIAGPVRRPARPAGRPAPGGGAALPGRTARRGGRQPAQPACRNVAPAPAPGTPTPTPRLRPLRPFHAAPGQQRAPWSAPTASSSRPRRPRARRTRLWPSQPAPRS